MSEQSIFDFIYPFIESKFGEVYKVSNVEAGQDSDPYAWKGYLPIFHERFFRDCPEFEDYLNSPDLIMDSSEIDIHPEVLEAYEGDMAKFNEATKLEALVLANEMNAHFKGVITVTSAVSGSIPRDRAIPLALNLYIPKKK